MSYAIVSEPPTCSDEVATVGEWEYTRAPGDVVKISLGRADLGSELRVYITYKHPLEGTTMYVYILDTVGKTLRGYRVVCPRDPDFQRAEFMGILDIARLYGEDAFNSLLRYVQGVNDMWGVIGMVNRLNFLFSCDRCRTEWRGKVRELLLGLGVAGHG